MSHSPPELKTLRDMIRWGMSRMSAANLFFGHGHEDALDEATALALHVCHLPHDLPGHFMDAALTEAEKQAIASLVQRRVEERIPAAYLTHEAWFAGMKFFVDERVLVPRSPMAELIENGFEPWLASPPGRILDLCTGSGCIALACAAAFPEAQVDAADISNEALAVARINQQRLGFEEQVRLVHSDVFDGLQSEHYDLIISNPPYVDRYEMAQLPAEYRHEPELGLAAGGDGLDIVHRILRRAAEHLTAEGVLIVEVGASWPALEAAYPEAPFTWLEFERGGEGVFLLTREQLLGIA